MKSLSLSALLASVRRHTGRAMVWLPWLGVALVIAAALSPGTVVASRLAFQSPPTNTPPPPATDTPVPPPSATDTPVPVAPEPAPTEAAPIQPSPTVAPAPAGEQPAPGTVLTPTGVLSPTAEATGLPVTSPEVTPPVQETESPTRLPKPKIEPSPASTGGQPIVNWVKFWDALVVTLAYPWLCCGVGLMLLVPIVLLYLEIKGRRPPPMPPESLPTESDGKVMSE